MRPAGGSLPRINAAAWVPAAAAFVYYLTLTADLILLWYFKERFGAKYLNTMEGGDYGFLTDWRVISYFILLVRQEGLEPTPYCLGGNC